MMPDKELSAKKELEAIEAKQAKIEAELARLKKERDQHRQAYVKELVAEAGALAEDIFGDLFKGAWAQKYAKLRELSGEILKLDPQSHNRLTANGDLYELDGDGVRFFGKFAFVALVNHKPLNDLINRAEKNPDNPFIKKEVKT